MITYIFLGIRIIKYKKQHSILYSGGIMVKLWRCEICGDPYVGETAPDNCPFCGAHKKYIKEARGQ